MKGQQMGSGRRMGLMPRLLPRPLQLAGEPQHQSLPQASLPPFPAWEELLAVSEEQPSSLMNRPEVASGTS